jgi:hypothetical protein
MRLLEDNDLLPQARAVNPSAPSALELLFLSATQLREREGMGDGGVANQAGGVWTFMTHVRSRLLVSEGLELDGLDVHLGRIGGVQLMEEKAKKVSKSKLTVMTRFEQRSAYIGILSLWVGGTKKEKRKQQLELGACGWSWTCR